MTRTSSILFWFSLIIVASLGLFRTSDRVQELDRQLRDTNAAIDSEKQSIHVLNAEWVYLANPARIAESSRKHLALRPTSPRQVMTMDSLPDMLPTRTEAMSTVAVNTAPMATIKTTLLASVVAPVAAHMPSPTVILSRAHAAKPVAVASADTGHIRDHMMMVERTASAAPLPGDSIGALISQLNAGR